MWLNTTFLWHGNSKHVLLSRYLIKKLVKPHLIIVALYKAAYQVKEDACRKRAAPWVTHPMSQARQASFAQQYYILISR